MSSTFENDPRDLVHIYVIPDRSEVTVMRRSDSKLLDIEIGYEHSWEDIESVMSGLANVDELEAARAIWALDESARVYEKTPRGLRIRLQ